MELNQPIPDSLKEEAEAHAIREFPILADGPIARKKELTFHNKICQAYIAGAMSRDGRVLKLIDALEKIRSMKLQDNETTMDYAFNRCWHLANTALTSVPIFDEDEVWEEALHVIVDKLQEWKDNNEPSKVSVITDYLKIKYRIYKI